MTGFFVMIGVFAAISVAVLLLIWVFGVWADRPRRVRSHGGYDPQDTRAIVDTEILRELRDSGYQG